jgi:hypothetical protein
MDLLTARKWIIISSFVISAGTFVFFIAAPALNFPLLYDQSWRLLQIVFPVFLGYLANATHFVFAVDRGTQEDQDQDRAARVGRHSDLAGLLIRWPIIIFGIFLVLAVAAFGYTNRRNAPVGTGMNVDLLATILSVALGLLTATTNVAVSYLFAVAEKQS